MGNFAAKQHAGALAAFATAALSLLTAAVALALLLATPKLACADETPLFKAREGVTLDALDDFDYLVTESSGWGVFLAANSAANSLDYYGDDAFVASVFSSDESVVQVKRLKYGDAWTVEGLKKGSATVTMTDVYGNTYSNTVNVVYADWGDGVEVMHRLYNPNTGEHFYTSDVDEVDSVVTAGWNYEGFGWIAPTSSETPVYRMYNPNPGPNGSGEHHYTTSAAEKEMLEAAGWNYEGIGWYSADDSLDWPDGFEPLYRQYNPNAYNCNHNYTTSKDENDYLVSLGWRSEGIAWYGLFYGRG